MSISNADNCFSNDFVYSFQTCKLTLPISWCFQNGSRRFGEFPQSLPIITFGQLILQIRYDFCIVFLKLNVKIVYEKKEVMLDRHRLGPGLV